MSFVFTKNMTLATCCTERLEFYCFHHITNVTTLVLQGDLQIHMKYLNLVSKSQYCIHTEQSLLILSDIISLCIGW